MAECQNIFTLKQSHHRGDFSSPTCIFNGTISVSFLPPQMSHPAHCLIEAYLLHMTNINHVQCQNVLSRTAQRVACCDCGHATSGTQTELCVIWGDHCFLNGSKHRRKNNQGKAHINGWMKGYSFSNSCLINFLNYKIDFIRDLMFILEVNIVD